MTDAQLWAQGGFAVALAIVLVVAKTLWQALRTERTARDADHAAFVALAVKSADAHQAVGDALERLQQEVEDVHADLSGTRRRR